MPIEILMPALSPTMTEGNLAKWLKQEGDDVAAGDVIAEIETDKATMEVEAVEEGKLGKILVGEGTEGVPVNAPIAILLEEGEAAASIGDLPEPASAAAPKPASVDPGSVVEEKKTPTPQAKPNGEVKPAAAGDRVFVSPLAKRMAANEGLDLASIDGSGPHGRIIKADIERALQAGADRTQAKPTASKDAVAAHVATDAHAEDIPLSNMRKVIARRLTEAKQTIPHFYLTMDCELDALLALRKQLNGREGADYKLSVNDFVIKASALALKKVPMANVSFAGDKLLQYTGRSTCRWRSPFRMA